MKKILFSFSLLAILGLTLSSCKKDSAEDDKECDITVASIAGSYKRISAKIVVGNLETDGLPYLYRDCQLDDIHELKADKTYIYTDAGTSCSPSGTDTGTWDLSGMTLTIDGQITTVESFNCNDLVVTYTQSGSGGYVRETYRRQ